MKVMICPWCNQRNDPGDLECRKCGGPLPGLCGSDPGPVPQAAPRKLPSGYKRRLLLTDSVLTIVGGIFLLVGLPFVIVFPIIGITTGMWLFVVIGGGLGGLFVILGGGMLYYGILQGFVKIRPLEYGQATIGEVVEIYRDTTIRINRQHPLAIVYVYKVHGNEYEGKIRSWKYDQDDLAVGDRVHVLYMPDAPEQSVIYPPFL